jgi:hypothetical protein
VQHWNPPGLIAMIFCATAAASRQLIPQHGRPHCIGQINETALDESTNFAKRDRASIRKPERYALSIPLFGLLSSPDIATGETSWKSTASRIFF